MREEILALDNFQLSCQNVQEQNSTYPPHWTAQIRAQKTALLIGSNWKRYFLLFTT